jgi:serine/threonine protein kinase
MPDLLTCAKGHQWEPATNVATLAPDAPVSCPVCGAPTMRQTLSAASEPRSGTLSLGQMPPVVETVQGATVSSAARPREKLPPDLPTVPGYEILGMLGHGGMGVVYKARQVNLNRLVALKMISAGVHASPQLLARFHVEAEAVASLQHPNIVQIYEVSEHDGCPYFSLEFMDGGALDEKFGGKPQPPRASAELVETLARAMHCAHQRGVIHRDLKPANVLLTAHGVAKITDFGLAKRLEDASQTQTGAILGTPSYMAPEQATGNIRAIGPATDVYALGAILYELLTGRPPFYAKSTMETLQQVQSREPSPLARWRVAVPRDLEIICLKCLEKEPRKRYASAEALANDLRRFLAGEPIKARPVSAWERAAKWARRRPALAALLLVSVLSALSLLGVGLSYHVRLQHSNDELKSALKSADNNFDRARRAVGKVLTVMAEEHLADKPHMEEKQKELLEEALKIYQEFLEERSSDPAMLEQTAQAYKRMGDILRMLGKYDPAKDMYRQAIELLTRLDRGAPSTSDYRDELAYSYNFLGEASRRAGHREEANEAYLQAFKLLEELATQFPQVPSYQRELSRTIYNLGILRADTSPKEAENLYQQAISRLEKLTPGAPAYQQDLARSYLNLGAVLGKTKRFAEAKQANDRAITLLEDLVNRFPTNRDYKHELALCCNNLGISLSATKQYDEAEKSYQKAVRTLTELTRDFSDVPEFRSQLANAYNSLGSLLDETLRLAAAKSAWLEALRIYEKLVFEQPDVPDYRAELGRVHGNLGWLIYHPLRCERELLEFFASSENQAGLGRIPSRLGWVQFRRAELGEARRHLEEGIKHLELALKSSPDNLDYLDPIRRQYLHLANTLSQLALTEDAAHAAEDYYCAAACQARLVPLTANNLQVTEPDRKGKAKWYAEMALANLKHALHCGYKDLDRLEKDPAFEPLRQQASFTKLLAVKGSASGQ